MKRFLPWQVVHLSVQAPLPDLGAAPGVGGLLVVWWSDRVPLGQLMLPSALLPIGSAQLTATASRVIAPAVGHRILKSVFEPPPTVPVHEQPRRPTPDLAGLVALNNPLEAIRRLATPNGSSRTSTSVIVCTKNRPEHLTNCLLSLRALSPSPDEIIVVDNDPSSALTRAVTKRFPEVRYVPETRPGLSVARNAGLRNCRGAIVAFTDDDVRVHEGWIAAIQEAFHDPEIAAVTGLVLPAELKTRAQYVFQTDALGWSWDYRTVDFDRAFFEGTKRRGAPVWRLGAGANMAFRREVFAQVGHFDERLGAGASGCSEDSELWYRLLAEGHRCRYTPSAVVFHHHRADWRDLKDQLHSYMKGHVAALFFQFERYRQWGNLYRAFLAIPRYLATIGLRSAKREIGRLLYDSGAAGLSQPLLPQVLGAAAGYVYYVRHRRRRAVVPGAATGAHLHAHNDDRCSSLR
jgi:GT2 family glycosyltransferase